MKFLELELLAYGPFTDTSLNLSDGECGLHIVHGPNEAGKSSTLRAIHGLLFGIKTNTSDNFLHPNPKLRIGGRLRNSASEEIHFHRRKGNKDTLLNPNTETGGAYSEDVLRPFLSGIDRDTFGRVYGIGHEQLEKGGREMQELRGLVGESLFAATVGGPGLADLMRELDEESAAVFASRKSSSTLKKLSVRRKEIESERRAVQLTMSSWKSLQSDLRKARERRDQVVNRERELSKQLRRLKRIQSSLSLITRRRETLTRIDGLKGATVLPEGYSAEDRNRTEVNLAAVRDRITQRQHQIEGESSLQHQIASIRIPDGLLDFEDAINELKDRRAVTLRAQADTVKLRRKVETLTTQAKDNLSDLGFDASLDGIEKHRLKPEDQIVIQNLAADAKRLRDQPQILAREREDLEAQVTRLENELKQLGDTSDVTELTTVLSQLPDPDDIATRRAELQRELDDVTRSCEQQLLALGLWTGSLKKLAATSMPLAETVQRFSEDFSQQQNAADLLQNETDKLQDELAGVREKIATLQTAGSVPTEDELNKLRHERDETWQRIRDDWLREAFTKSMPIAKAEQLASDFARSISDSDHLADRLRRETERVAQLASHTARQERIEDRIQQIDAATKKTNAEATALEKEWKKLWKPAGVSEPLSPAEMMGWLRRVEELRETITESTNIAEHLRELADKEKTAADSLRAHLKSIGQKALVKDPLITLTTHARTLIETANQEAEHIEQLSHQLSQLQSELEKLTRDEKRVADELKSWQGQWAPRMKQLGCDEDAIAEQANERINVLNRLFDLVRQIRDEEQRIVEIESDAEQFQTEAGQLASRFMARSDLNPTEAAIELFNVLQTAKTEQSRLESLQEAEHNANVELLGLQDKQAGLVQELEALCRLAGVQDAASLPEKERESTELAELLRRQHELEDQLHEQAAGRSLDEFIADANTVDAEELPDEIDRIERELADLEGERDAAVVAVNDLENQAAEADGNDKAVNLGQESLGILSTMHDQAQRYMQLKLAATMLRKQIEVHRAENEDPLLQRASGLFETMTCTEFAGLRTDYENDQPVIVGVRGDDSVVPVSGMSDGTRNQLYLALRLGYLEHQLTKFEPMPFIVDDILIHFDDQRATATLQVLSELALSTQVIFLTHHQHLVELAKANLPSNQLFVHELDSRNRKRERRVAGPERPR